MILVDSNIPMYLVGASHPHKSDTLRLLEKVVGDRQRLVTEAEVLQEILRRYVAINRREPSSRRLTLCLESWMKCSLSIKASPNVRRKLF